MITPPTTDPDFTPAQVQSPAGGDPDFTPAQVQSTAPTPGSGFRPEQNMEELKGLAKGGMKTLAGMLEAAGTPQTYTTLRDDPGTKGPNSQVIAPVKKITDWLRSHSQINNLDQQTGNLVESIGEFLPFMEAEAPTMVEKLAMQTDLAKFATKYPKIGAFLNSAIVNSAKHVMGGAARGAVEQGVQTSLKTGGDEDATEEAAKTGAEFGGGGAALGEALGGLVKVGKGISSKIESLRPGTRTVAGADFDTMPGAATPGEATPVLRNPKDVLQDPATQAVDEAMGNIGRTAVANSVNRTNAMRAPEAEIIPPSRRLPGRAGFEVGPAAEPTPVVEGQTGFDPGKQHIGTNVVEGKGPGTFSLPTYSPELADAAAEASAAEGTLGATEPQPEPVGSHKEPIFQYRNATRPGSPEPGTDVAKGPGTLILTDDGQALSSARARQQLAQYDRILNDPNEVEQLGVRQHADIQRAREDLAGQLDRYDNFAASQPHFPPHDVLDMVRNTDSIGDAGQQLKDAHGPFWDAADKASGNKFSELRDEEKWLQRKFYSEAPSGNLEDIRQQLMENRQKQMDFFDKYKTTVSPQEWETARSGYQDGIVLSNLDDFLQSKFNGIDRGLEQRGIASGNKRQRLFEPPADFNEQLRNFYNTGMRGTATNGEVLQRTIGQQHMDSLHDLGIMFNSGQRMEQTQGLVKTTLSSILRHYHGVKGILAAGAGGVTLAATLGMREAGIAGVPLLTGTSAGLKRYLTERLITDPDFLKSFSYAIRKGVPPTTAGPLLAARIISTWNNQQRQQPQQSPTGGQ